MKPRTLLVIGVVLGYLLLLVALRAPLIAALGVVTNLQAARRGGRRREADLTGGPRLRPAGLRVTGLPGCLGSCVLLLDDFCDQHG
jgi:hypothetical protein